MALLDDLADAIQNAALIPTGTALLIGSAPDEPSDLIALRDYSGMEPVYSQERNAPQYERPRVQILVRGKRQEYEIPRILIAQIYQLVAALRNVTLGGSRILSVSPLQYPFLLEWDGNERAVFVFNIQVEMGV